MHHPYSKLRPDQQKRLFFVLLAASIGISLVMNNVGSSLETVQAPGGIVSFEFSWTVQKAQAILDSWNETAKIHAGFIQGLDYLFLLVYSQAFALACLLADQRLGQRGWVGSGWGSTLAWGMWLAAILDAIENFGLVVLLFGSLTEPWPAAAALCAAGKFGLLSLGLVYSLAGWISGWLKPERV